MLALGWESIKRGRIRRDTINAFVRQVLSVVAAICANAPSGGGADSYGGSSSQAWTVVVAIVTILVVTALFALYLTSAIERMPSAWPLVVSILYASPLHCVSLAQ